MAVKFADIVDSIIAYKAWRHDKMAVKDIAAKLKRSVRTVRRMINNVSIGVTGWRAFD